MPGFGRGRNVLVSEADDKLNLSEMYEKLGDWGNSLVFFDLLNVVRGKVLWDDASRRDEVLVAKEKGQQNELLALRKL